MFRFIWAASIRVHNVLRWAPTNLLLDRIRSRRGRKWGIPAMLLVVPFVLAAAACVSGNRDGGPGWLNLLVILFIWDALKFLVMGPASLLLLAHVRAQEAWARRRAKQANHVVDQAAHA